jgi:hypothetical protein
MLADDELASLTIEGSGRWNVSRREVGLRPYPFPFAAGFALSNENTYERSELFEEAHDFVNGRGQTAFGEGLGLEVGDSVALGPEGAPRLAGDGSGGERLRLLMDAGWLDQVYCPDPATAGGLNKILGRLAPPIPPVWLGPTDGDAMKTLVNHGVRYFGDEALVEIEKFGDHHDYRKVERLRLAARRYDWTRVDTKRRLWGRRDLDGLMRTMNRTLQPADKGAVLRFKRYRGGWTPSMPGFSGQVSSVLLDQLTSHAGLVIVQQQMGRWALIGAAEGKERARPVTGPARDRHAVAAWTDIAERNAAGRLWVATVSRVLDHLMRRDALVFRVDKSAERWVIVVQGLKESGGRTRTASIADLDGVAFTAPETAPDIVLTLKDARAPLPSRRASDPVHKSMHAVYRPWLPLEWPGRAAT